MTPVTLTAGPLKEEGCKTPPPTPTPSLPPQISKEEQDKAKNRQSAAQMNRLEYLASVNRLPSRRKLDLFEGEPAVNRIESVRRDQFPSTDRYRPY